MSDAPPPPAAPDIPPAPPVGYAPPVPPAGYYGQPVPAPQTTNVLAIISLVISILGFNVIAIILGAIGLSQIKRTGEKGRGLALAGIWIGAISLLLGVIVIVIFLVIAVASAGLTQTS